MNFSSWWSWDKWWSCMVLIKESGNTDSPLISTKAIAEEAYKAGYEEGKNERN